MIIGVTGIFGSGKSTVASLLKKKGFMHINADAIGHTLLQEPSIHKKVVHEFGKGIISGKRIDRSKLKQIVFHDPSKLKILNRIIHPAILTEIRKILKKNKNR